MTAYKMDEIRGWLNDVERSLNDLDEQELYETWVLLDELSKQAYQMYLEI